MVRAATSTRRTVLGGLAAALAAPAIRPSWAQTNRTLTVQAPGAEYEDALRRVIIPEFKDKYGYSVSFVAGSSPTVLPKLLVARGRPPYDVVTINNDTAHIGASAGLWKTDIEARLSNLEHIYPSMRPPKTAVYGLMYYEYPLVFNTNRMAAPTSWHALWDDGVTVALPDLSTTYGMTFLYMCAVLNGGSAENLSPGFEAIGRLKRYKIYRNVSQGISLFEQGEVDAGLFYGHRAQQMMNAGLRIGKTRPKEGVWGQRGGAQIPKNTTNLEGAIAWVNMALDVKYQTVLAEHLYSPTNRNVVLGEPLASWNLMGEQTAESVAEPPWNIILPQRDALLDRWSRQIRG